MLRRIVFIFAFAIVFTQSKSQERTYAERLGFPKGSKVLILHIDDVGMSWDSNQGAIRAMEEGVANSLSIMMPCGHNTMIGSQRGITAEMRQQLREIGKKIWSAGLPVLDDLHNVSYDFEYPEGENVSDDELQKIATSKYIETIRKLKPGLSMVMYPAGM